MTADDALLTLDQAAALVPGADANTLKRRKSHDLDLLVPDSEWIWYFFSAQVRHGRQRSAERGLSYALSVEFLSSLAERQDYRCAVSKIKFVSPNRRREPFSPSIDRIDNRFGYEPDNVRLVCLIVNLARNDFGDEAVLKMARAVVAANQ